jgi:agmatinase
MWKMLSWNRGPDTFLGCDSGYEDARIVLLGVPFDGTTSYRPGTRFASRVMRAESYSMETYSPYQDKDLSQCKVFDGGDLELPYGNTTAVLDLVEAKTALVLNDGKIPLVIGGEHLVTLGAIRAAVKKHSSLCIIHLDAHTDLREEYLGETFSHATVIRRCWDLLGNGRINQFGIRSGDKAEFEWAAGHTRLTRFDLGGLSQAANELAGRPVYLTIDLDVLDPSVFPGTGTPEAGGITFTDLARGMLALKGMQIVGCDLVELSPPYDPSGISTAAALKALRELLCLI